jgi:hypothetical protein
VQASIAELTLAEGDAEHYCIRSAAAICELASEVIAWPAGDAKSALKDEIWDAWGYPNCVGFVDGTHINLAGMPSMDRSVAGRFYTYKKRYSLLVIAVCDTQCKFTYACVGNNGAVSDARALADCDLVTDNRRFFGPNEYIIGDSGFTCTSQLVCVYPRPANGGQLLPYQVSCMQVHEKNT